MKTSEHIFTLCVEQQPLQIIIYHKVLRLALAFGSSDEHAEEIAESASQHLQNRQNASLLCAIENEKEQISLIISDQHEEIWQEFCKLPSYPDCTTIKEQQLLLTGLSIPGLLQQMQQRQNELQQQRNDLRQETERLTAKILHTNMAMEHQAMHDKLTSLPNRPLLIERATHALQIAKRQHFNCCLLVMDLNDFKDINDALGHQIGDLMLQEVASRFKHCLRNSDTLARLGGDEFAALLLNTNAEQAQVVAKKLHKALLQPFELGGNTLSVGISIGITEFPEHGEDVLSLLRRADVAMYHAKHKKLSYSIYNPLLDEHSIERLALLNDLNHAIKEGGLELYYQPQVLTAGDGLPSLEALIRWTHPQKGLVFPDRFIPMAEDSGLITPMTWWVMETAVAQCAAWHKAGLPVNVSINFSAHCLQETDVAERVEECIKRHALPDNALVLEITESMIMEDPHQASTVLLKIDAMKVDVAIDDFGTGHSSLAYLKHLLVDELKIDRSFVMGMHEHDNDEIIVRTAINMAHSMGLRVVGEGVEDRKSWDALTAMGCERIQGYFISRPLPVDQITRWLEAFSQDGLKLDDI